MFLLKPSPNILPGWVVMEMFADFKTLFMLFFLKFTVTEQVLATNEFCQILL